MTDPHLLDTGKFIEVGAGPGGWPRTAVVKRTNGTWFWIQEGIWPCYEAKYGGPDGPLGYPVGLQEYDEVRRLPFQKFEHGVLYRDEVRGVLTSDQLTGSDAGCTSSSRSFMMDVFRVESNPGGVPHEILPGGRVEQDILATTASIDEVSVIVGLDPRSDTGGAHMLRLEILSSGRGIAAGESVPLMNNAWTSLFNKSLSVTVGARLHAPCHQCIQP